MPTANYQGVVLRGAYVTEAVSCVPEGDDRHHDRSDDEDDQDLLLLLGRANPFEGLSPHAVNQGRPRPLLPVAPPGARKASAAPRSNAAAGPKERTKNLTGGRPMSDLILSGTP